MSGSSGGTRNRGGWPKGKKHSDKTRLKMLRYMSQENCSASDLANYLDMNASTISRHLKLFMDSYPERAKRGFLVCRCPKPFALTANITAVPWSEI